MADSGANTKQRQTQKKKNNKKRKHSEPPQESERPTKTNRTISSETNENEPQDQNFEVEGAQNPKQGGPWRNLELILSIQNKELDLNKKVELAYGFVMLRVKEGGGSSDEDDQAVGMPRLVIFVSEWIQSLLISEGRKVQSGEEKHQDEVIYTYLDLRCWEIFKFCLEESLRLNVSISLSRNLLRSICWIARSALSLLNKASSSRGDFFAFGEGFQLYTTVLDCISLVFSSKEGFPNENLNIWISTVSSALDLGHRIFSEALVSGNDGVFVSQFLCLVLERFSRFLRSHAARKNGFHDFSDKLLEPLLHLYGLLHLQIGGGNLDWMGSLLKLVKDVLSHGLYHPLHIDGFLSLCSTEKYSTSKYGKSEDPKTMNESYHRHLFDKVGRILAAKSALAVESLGVLFQLLIDQVKKLKRDSALTASAKVMGKSEGSRQIEHNSLGQTSMMSSESCTIEEKYCSTSLNPETRKPLYYFFVLIMEPLLLEINGILETKLKVGTELLEVHRILKAINSVLSVFMHEKIYVRTEDASEGACLHFLKKVYSIIISLSSEVIQLSVTHSDSFTLIANEVLSAVGYLLAIEYDVLENDQVSLWLMMLSYLAIGLSLVDSPDRCLLLSKITDNGCELIMFYSQLRQVNNTIFALCKAIRIISLHNSDGELNYTRFVIPFHGEAYAKSVEMLLCAHDFKIAIHKAMKFIPEGQASQCIRQLTLDVSKSLEWMQVSCLEADEKESAECQLSNLHSFNLEAELFGRGLSEVYALLLDSLIVTTGNCNLLGASIKELIRVIFPCMSKLIGQQQKDAVIKFLSSVMVKDYDKVIARNKNKCLIFGGSSYWVVLFFFRLYTSCRCLYRQAAILMPPDLSRKMSAEMGHSFSSFSGRDWMEMSDWANEGFFSWIIQPSASLLAVIRSVSSIFCKDSAADSCPLTYVMHAMACERLVDLNSRIKSIEYLIENGDNLVPVAEISSLRQEAAGLTGFMMEHLSIVSKDQQRTFTSADMTNNKMASYESDEWDFGICSVNKNSLPTAVWWVVCQNIHAWCPHASEKDLKRFLSVLIRTSLPYVKSYCGEVIQQKNHEADRLKNVAVHQISSQCFIDSSLYEQRFVRRYFAKLFCRALEKSTLPFISDFPSINVKFKSSPNWSDVLSDLESSSLAISCDKLIVFNCSSASSCKGLNSHSSAMVKFTACQSLLNLLSCMPKGHLDMRSFSHYVTCILNIERIVVAGLLDYKNASYSSYYYELFRLFVSCRKALRCIIIACEETVATQSSDTRVLFEDLLPVLWLQKSVHMVARLQESFSKDIYHQVHDIILALLDHTFYVFLTLSKYESNCAVRLLEVTELNSECAHEQKSSLNSSHYIKPWESVNVVAKSLKEQMQMLLVNVKGSICIGKEGVAVDGVNLNKFASIISCFSGFLWGLACSVIDTDGRNSDEKAKLSSWRLEQLSELNLCINVFAEISSLLLQMFSLDDNQQSATVCDVYNLQKSGYNLNLLGAEKIFPEGSDVDTDMACSRLQNKYADASSEIYDDPVTGSVHRRKPRLKDANSVVSVLTAVDSFELQTLNKPLLRSMLKGDLPSAAFLLRQLLIASSAILRLNLHVKSAPMSTSLVHKFAGIMQVLLLESVDASQVPHFYYFVCLDGVLKYLEELGNHFPLTNPTLSRDLFAKMIQLQLWALGKCITLQGKRATLASHESSTNIFFSPTGFSEASTLSGWEYLLDDLKARLRSAFAVFIKKSTELHLQSLVQAIERALLGVREGCTVRYDIYAGLEDGGKVSSIVASGIDCLDLVLEFVSGRNLSVVKKYIQKLIACMFNVILHLQSPLIFYDKVTQSKDDNEPDSGTVILMCVDVLARISGKHAIYKMDLWHVAHSLRIPSAIFQDFHLLNRSKCSVPNVLATNPNNQLSYPVSSARISGINRQYSIGLYSACCRLLHNVVKHHKSECEGYVALLQASVRVLLYCLETLDAVLVAKEGLFSWEVEEGVKCACSLRRIYEELRHQKEVFGPHCYHFLAYYIQVYSGYGPRKTGIKREIDEALRPGVYALIDVCSPDDLQRLHTSFGEGPCRNTLATLKHDYELNFQYQGKV
ncbi:uncharacterized protein LOC126782016 [Argentina anserina]|uniref:uncharacterized protein LOC126782016 n=1 Tax=Argentina anserina TaxID=57926 RepID=UPI00217644BF|nr:uncharacterized protein LOC126782016 [Potentilla anserina]